MKRPPPGKARQMEEELYAGVEAGTLDMGAASRLTRKILGLSQREYAKRVLKISPRVLIDFERGVGNPTLATLLKIVAPFGLRVGFVRFPRDSSPQEEGSASRDEASRDKAPTGSDAAKRRTWLTTGSVPIGGGAPMSSPKFPLRRGPSGTWRRSPIPRIQGND